ncbi:MAG: hypothetical protein JNM90_14925 [Burkholderiales bacterium]|nr:hypothetical protein [Burkholderiales bacterium]
MKGPPPALADAGMPQALAQLARTAGLPVRSAHAHRGTEAPAFYLYVELGEPQALASAVLSGIESEVAEKFALPPEAVQGFRLRRVLERDGAAAGRAAHYHYVVETNAAPGWMGEVARWYEEEHLPGLAQVPGCVRACRYVNLDGDPSSVACYDLEAPDVLSSPAWLAVRATAWSDRVRPQFRDTRRTMFRTGARHAPGGDSGLG